MGLGLGLIEVDSEVVIFAGLAAIVVVLWMVGAWVCCFCS